MGGENVDDTDVVSKECSASICVVFSASAISLLLRFLSESSSKLSNSSVLVF